MASDTFNSVCRNGVLTKREIFKWRIPRSLIQHFNLIERSDVFTFGSLKFYLMLSPTSTSNKFTRISIYNSHLSLFLCRIGSDLKDRSQLNKFPIKVVFSLLDKYEKMHHISETTMHSGTERVLASFNLNSYDIRIPLQMVVDGYVTFQCSLDINEAIVENGTTPAKETAKMMKVTDKLSFSDLMGDFSSLLERGFHSDVTLCVDGKEFPVHRAILSAHSPVFAAMFKHDTVEQKENRVVIEDVSADTVSHLLFFMYTGTIPELSVQAALCLFVASDKYTLPKLKKKCSRFLCSNLTTDMMLNVLITANLHNDANLKETAIEGVLGNAELTKSDEWLMFLKEYPELANGIFKRLVTK